MNEYKMELEEAIRKLYVRLIYLRKRISTSKDNSEVKNPLIKEVLEEMQAIETVLQELENSIPKKKIEDKMAYWNKRLNEDERLDWIIKDKCIINVLQELLEDK